MKAYKFQRRVLYVQERINRGKDTELIAELLRDEKNKLAYTNLNVDIKYNLEVHYVYDGHFKEYLALRKTIPHYCVLFGKIKDRKTFLENEKGVLI